MKPRKMTLIAGLVILFGVWILPGFSQIHAQPTQPLDLSGGIVLDQIRSSGFISPKPIASVGTLAGSDAAQVNMSQGDLIYIKLEPGKQVKPGDRFYVVRWGREIIHPATEKKLGNVVRIAGVAVILDGRGPIVPARISESFFQVGYGDLIIPPTPGPPAILPTRMPEKIKGSIVASPEEEENITERVAVYIDRGARDGLILGDLFSIYQMPYFTKETKESGLKLPLLKVGEGVIVHLEDETSTLLVTKSFQAIYIGDTIVSGRDK